MSKTSNRLLLAESHVQMHDWFASLLAKSSAGPSLILAPSRGAADDLVRRIPGPGLLGVHRMTPVRLAASLAAGELAERGLAPISALAAEALCARIVHQLNKTDRLPYFRPVAQTPGFARALRTTLYELRAGDVQPSDLKGAGPAASDLAALLAEYQDELQRRRLVDMAGVLRLATESQRPHPLLGIPLFLLDVPVEPVWMERFLSKLASKCELAYAAVLQPDSKTASKLSALLGIEAEHTRTSVPSDALSRTRRFLFAPESPAANDSGDAVGFFSAPGEAMECVEIARRIRALAMEGFAFDEVAVFLRDPGRYQTHLEEAFRRAGIPAWFSQGTARPDPAGRAFLALLHCALENCSASRFAEYLSLGQIPQAGPEPAPAPLPLPEDDLLASFQPASIQLEPPADPGTRDSSSLNAPAGWEKLLTDAAVVGSPDRWRRRLRGLEAELQTRKREAVGDPSYSGYLDQEILRLRALSTFAIPLIETLAALPPLAGWDDWLATLTALARRSLRSPQSVLLVLSELSSMEGVGPAGLDEVLNVLSERMRFLRRDPPSRRYGHVYVGSADESRARVFRMVFLPGLGEGLFPRRDAEDPLLLDAARAQLPVSLPVGADRVIEERLRLERAVAASSFRLTYSWARIDVADQRARVPSLYALELIRAAEGRIPVLPELERRARQACALRLDWPAPADPAAAVDSTEFDLAAVRRSMTDTALRKGRLRYLLDVSPPLARSLRTYGRRWRNFWSAADGFVDPGEESLQALSQHSLQNKAYSASALQNFAACPYRFLLYGVLELRVPDSAAGLEQLDPLTRGAIFHEMQRDILRSLQRAAHLPVTTLNLASTLDTADAVVEAVARKYEEELAPAIAPVWRNQMEDLRTDLRGWLQQMAQEGGEWLPAHFELGFGLKPSTDRDSASTEHVVVLDGVRLRGVIDMVETHSTRGTLRVTDHKTGKVPDRSIAYVGGGAALQPVMYAMAAQQILGRKVEQSRLSYCTQRGAYAINEIAPTAQAQATLERLFQIVDRQLTGGFFPAFPERNACVYCDYRIVCGPDEERRTALKQRDDRLHPLMDIRSMP